MELNNLTTATGGDPAGTATTTEPTVTVLDNQQGQAGSGNVPTEPTKTYTAEELQAETDRRVTEALKTAKEKSDAEWADRLTAEKQKWDKQAKMTAEEREKAAQQEAQAQFEQERSQFNAERLEFECTRQLAEEKLPVEFAKMLTGSDDESTKANIDTFKSAFSKAVSDAVTERLKGSPPPAPGSGGSGGSMASLIEASVKHGF